MDFLGLPPCGPSVVHCRGNHVSTSPMLPSLHVQTHIDGMNNVWIVKPAALSRGRGIRLFNDIEQLFQYIKSEGKEGRGAGEEEGEC